MKALLASITLLLTLGGCGSSSSGGSASSTAPLKIIAHRGASYYAPENTLAAFNLAWQQDADGVELDVYLSKDNKIMVIHDPTTGRTAGTDLVVRDTASNVLRELDVGVMKGSQFAGEKIPFLEEVIATIPAGKTLYVEVKTGTEILPFLQEVLNHTTKKQQIVVQSFTLEVVAELKKLMPEIPVLYIVGSYVDQSAVIQKAVSNKLDGMNIASTYVKQSIVAAAKAAGLQFFSYVVDDDTEARTFREFGIDGIMTDLPKYMKEALQ